MPKDALANPTVLAVLARLVEAPAHPYELAKSLPESSVEINRASLYGTVAAMARADLIAAVGREQHGARPERTVYSITSAGRAELARRLDTQIRTPRREYPEFLGAVSHLGVLGPLGAAEALGERLQHLGRQLENDARRLDVAVADGSVPRLFVIEAEYALQMKRAELAWVRDIIDQIESGELRWPEATKEDL